jgi:hypothetical protein
VTAGGATVGTAALPFSSVYIGNAATNNIQLTGTSASAKVVTLPGQTGTVVVAPVSTTATQAVFATATSGLAEYRAIATADLPAALPAASTMATSLGVPLINLGTGISLTGGAGVITFTDLAGTSEVLALDLRTADTAKLTTTSGIATLDIGALALVTTGAITGAIKVEKDDDTLAAAQCYGTFHWYSGGAETITLPAAVVGMNLCIYASDASVKNIDPNGTDTIVLNGTALAAGYQIESPGAVGNFICLASFTANQWTTLGQSGVWVTHGAD